MPFLLVMLMACGQPDAEQIKPQSNNLGWGGVCTAEFDNKHLEKYQYIIGPKVCIVKIAVYADAKPLEGLAIILWFSNYLKTAPEVTDANGLASFSVDAGSNEIVSWEINYSESDPKAARQIRTMDLCEFGINMTKPLTIVQAIPKDTSADISHWPTIRYCTKKSSQSDQEE